MAMMSKEDWTPGVIAFANVLSRRCRQVSEEQGIALKDVNVEAIAAEMLAANPDLCSEPPADPYEALGQF
jgi:hypothetical protein